jgi:hypothetical protein
MSSRRIKLTRYAANTVEFNNYGAYRLRVEVTEVEGADMDENIFIYERQPADPQTQETRDVFKGIAGPFQLAAIPAFEPNPNEMWPFFRLNFIELDFASTAEAEAVWNAIQSDVNALVYAMERLSNLQAIQEVWYPSDPDPNSQSSQSI